MDRETDVQTPSTGPGDVYRPRHRSRTDDVAPENPTHDAAPELVDAACGPAPAPRGDSVPAQSLAQTAPPLLRGQTSPARLMVIGALTVAVVLGAALVVESQRSNDFEQDSEQSYCEVFGADDPDC